MRKSSDMPSPQTFNYGAVYKVTPLFINDLKKVMADVAYVDAIKLFDEIKERGGVFPAAVLNEFILKISSFPYKYVNQLMDLLNREETFFKYFEVVDMNARKNG